MAPPLDYRVTCVGRSSCDPSCYESTCDQHALPIPNTPSSIDGCAIFRVLCHVRLARLLQAKRSTGANIPEQEHHVCHFLHPIPFFHPEERPATEFTRKPVVHACFGAHVKGTTACAAEGEGGCHQTFRRGRSGVAQTGSVLRHQTCVHAATICHS